MADLLIDPMKLKAAVRRAGRDPHRVVKMLKKWQPKMAGAKAVMDEREIGKLVEESRGTVSKMVKLADKSKSKKPNPAIKPK